MPGPFYTPPDVDPESIPKNTEEFAQQWEELFEGIRSGLKTLNDKEIELQREVNRGLALFPPLGPYFASAHKMVLDLWKQVSDYLIDLLTRPGNPAALMVASDKWGEVAKELQSIDDHINGSEKPKSGLPYELGTPYVDAQRHWKGDAAERYTEAKANERESLSKAKTLANTLQDGLLSIAHGLIALYAALATAVIALIAELIGGIAAIVAEGIGFAIIAGALLTFLGQAVALGSAYAGWLGTTKMFSNALSDAGFENNAWKGSEPLTSGWGKPK